MKKKMIKSGLLDKFGRNNDQTPSDYVEGDPKYTNRNGTVKEEPAETTSVKRPAEDSSDVEKKPKKKSKKMKEEKEDVEDKPLTEEQIEKVGISFDIFNGQPGIMYTLSS